MYAPRTVINVQRAARVGSRRIAARRSASGTTGNNPTGSNALTGGLIGGTSVLVIGYAWYHFSGVKDAVSTAQQGQQYVRQALNTAKSFPDKAPSGSEAVKVLRETADRYAAFIPGGKAYVDSTFRTIEDIHEQHGEEVDKIIGEAHAELSEVSKKGFSIEAASETVDVLVKHTSRLTSLAGTAANDLLGKYPQLKQKLGASADQFSGLADRLGPEMKKQLDELLRQGNVSEVIDKIRNAISTGDIGGLEKFLKQAKGKGSKQMSQWLDGLPEGGQFLGQLQSLQELASSKGHEAEELLKETVKEAKELLDSKMKKADQIRKDVQDRK